MCLPDESCSHSLFSHAERLISHLSIRTHLEKTDAFFRKLCIRICLYGKWTSSETAASFSSTVSSITCIANPELLSRDGGQLQQRRLIQAEYMFLSGPQNLQRLLSLCSSSPKIKTMRYKPDQLSQQWSAPNRTKPRFHVAPSRFDVSIIK